MRKPVRNLSLALFALIVVGNVPHATPSVAVEPTDEPRLVIVANDSPTVSAASYAVFDIETGDMLFSANADVERPIASVTKLLFAAQAVSQMNLEQTVIITEADVATHGRAGKLQVGEQYTARELLFPLLLESSNDAATALARTVDEVRYGNLQFADGSGLSDRNVASAAELADAARDIYHTHPHVFDMTTIEQYIGPYTGWVNNSPVRTLDGYKGGKHGYTEAAGRTIVAVFTESALAERELGYILLDSSDLYADVQQLRDHVAHSVRLQ